MKKSKSEVLRKIHGAQVCQLIATGTRLGLFDRIAESPQTAEALAEALGIQLRILKSLLYSLEASHLLHENEGVFTLTEEGQYLTSNHEDSLQEIAIYKGSPTVWHALGQLYDGICEGRSPFELAFGCHLFEYLDNNDEEFEVFHNAMKVYEQKSSKKILDLYDFSPFTSLIDLGGGFGTFLTEILKKTPGASGVVFDLPKVCQKAESHQSEPSPRLTFRGGNFFEEVPKGFDGYLLRNILHNWSDEKSIELLHGIQQAMGNEAKLLIFETLIEEDSSKRLGKFSNINMFVLTDGGRERSLEAIRELLHSAELKLKNVIRSSGSKALLEVIKEDGVHKDDKKSPKTPHTQGD